MPKITYVNCEKCNAINITYRTKNKKPIESISCWRCKKISKIINGYYSLMGFER